MSALFTLLGWFEIGCGLICIPTALFVGPHLLAVAIVSVGLGIGSLTVARGFRSGAKWATWTGAALCAIIVVVASIAIVQRNGTALPFGRVLRLSSLQRLSLCTITGRTFPD